MHVVGAMSLLDWRPDLGHSALALFRDHVTLELMRFGGYLVSRGRANRRCLTKALGYSGMMGVLEAVRGLPVEQLSCGCS